MLNALQEFRDRLDAVMYQCMDRRISLYGYNYSGRFVGWYAEYYHGIRPDYIITNDYSSNIPYEFQLYRESIFDFDYKDVKDSVVWLCIPETDEIREKLRKNGFIKDRTYFNFCELIYEGSGVEGNGINVQFYRWLEEIYGCDLVTSVSKDKFLQELKETRGFVGMTPKELFPLLDKCHISVNSSIFDFGCGKGGAMLSFLDYGFKKVGGVEFQNDIYNTMIQNFKKIGLQNLMENGTLNCINGDASKLSTELDGYDCFFFFNPFAGELFERVIAAIIKSLDRIPREIYIIYINPECHAAIERTGRFELTNRFDIMTRQRVVNVYVSKKMYERNPKCKGNLLI